MASFVDSLAAPMSVINALIVSLGLHRKEELSRHFKQLEAIWAANDVYWEKSMGTSNKVIRDRRRRSRHDGGDLRPQTRAHRSRCWSAMKSWARRFISPARVDAT